MKKLYLVASVMVFAVFAISPTHSAEAAFITDSQIADQKVELQESVNLLLKEELKLVQMIFIQLLEKRVKQLEAQTNTSK